MDPKRSDQACKGARPRCIDGCEQIVRYFARGFLLRLSFLLRYSLKNVCTLQRVNISNISDFASLDEFFNNFDSKPNNVHCAARDEVFDVAYELRGAGSIDTIPGHLAFDKIGRA